jgi:plastocyanin
VALAAAFAVLPGAADAATRRVAIKPSKFDPAVVVVAPRTNVEWRNDDSRARALRGDFESPDIAPGRTYERRFSRLGRYDYRDRDNPAITGTVVVAAGRPRYPRPRGRRMVTHRWRGSLRVDLRERWKYFDGKFLSFQGPCNAEVGDGSREITFHARFPRVRYTRFGSLEILRGVSRPYGIQRYRELIDAKTSHPTGGRYVSCGDGSTDAPPDVEQKCDHNYAGTRVRAELSWSPRATRGRFQWPHRYLGRRPPSNANCGASFLAAGSLVGLNLDALPFDPGAGQDLLYEHGRTGPVTLAEARALRAGRRVNITRSIELHFTVDCCVEWNEEGKPGTYVRAGARFDVLGRVTIHLRPR